MLDNSGVRYGAIKVARQQGGLGADTTKYFYEDHDQHDEESSSVDEQGDEESSSDDEQGDEDEERGRGDESSEDEEIANGD